MATSIALVSLLVLAPMSTVPFAAVSAGVQEPEGPAASDQAGDAGGGEGGDAAATPAAATPAGTPKPTETTPARYSQWHLQIAPGFGYVRGPQNAYTALGGSARFAAWRLHWRNNFMIGGGPALVYGYLYDGVGKDKIHLFTVNGDFVIGGGKADKFAVYAHMTLGLGILKAIDGAGGKLPLLPGIRAAAGVGVHGYLTRRLSLGALIDFGYMGGLGLDAFLTLGYHFGKKPK